MPLERAVENSAASSSTPINKPPQGGFFIGKSGKIGENSEELRIKIFPAEIFLPQSNGTS